MENINVTNVTLPTARNAGYEHAQTHTFTSDMNQNFSTPSNTNESSCGFKNEIIVNPCDEIICHNLGDFYPDSQGCILELSLTLKNVCRGKRVAVGILLYEINCNNEEYPRGFKTLEIPDQEQNVTDDIEVKNIRFILPNTQYTSGNMNQRRFVVKVVSHYIDFNTDNQCQCM